MDEMGLWLYFKALNNIKGFNIRVCGEKSYIICNAKKQVYIAEPGPVMGFGQVGPGYTAAPGSPTQG